MNFTKVLSFLFLLLFSANLAGQSPTLSGKVTDGVTGEPLIGATVQIGDTGTTTDFDGNYNLTLEAGEQTIEASYIGYESVSKVITAGGEQALNFELGEEATLLQTATVTSGKFEKPLSEVTVSLEVIKADLLENTNSTSVDEVLGKVPGVQLIDGQPNIRGGSGFSYGAGSRVMLLMDDIPILQADAGSVNWDDIPVENIDQIEVVKGAASALYGSSALNGIINVRTAYAKSKPKTSISSFYTYFDDPADKSQILYKKQPYEFGLSGSHRQKFDKLDLVLGGYYLNRESFNQKTYDRYGRGNASLRYRISDNLVIGVNANVTKLSAADFFFWRGTDSLFFPAPNTISQGERLRYNIDPQITYFDKNKNRHKILSRYHSIDNDNNANQGNQSQLLYSEYQFQRKWENGFVSTAGLVYIGNSVQAELYNDTTFSTRNLAAYVQLEKKFFNRLNLSGGFRYEINRLKTPELICTTDIFGGEVCDTIPNGIDEEAKPVFRLGANYQAADFTFVRASWGQGYRYPTIAEKFIRTDFGGAQIGSNPALESETGWSTELGVKQGYKFGGFNGFVDVSGFWSQYNNMMEFNLTGFIPTTFRSINVGGTDIRGLEVTFAGQGDIMGMPANLLAGYTHLNPQFQEFDDTPREGGKEPTEGQLNFENSSSNENILKYRSRNYAKLDFEISPKPFSVGVAFLYNSPIVAIDDIFERFDIVPGIKQYRVDNPEGNLIFSARVSYRFLKEKAKFSLVANNLSNKMYSIRPGIMEAPRSITGRLDYTF